LNSLPCIEALHQKICRCILGSAHVVPDWLAVRGTSVGFLKWSRIGIMASIPIIDSDSELGIPFRQRRPGPECDLIEAFLERNDFKTPRGCCVTAFREPCLESGFPDLVIVVWHVATARQWNPERVNLRSEDLRVMQFVLRHGPTPDSAMHAITGTDTSESLKRLEAAGMVRKAAGQWRARPLSTAFAVRTILAIEAKIKEWEVVLRQAWLNTWFASESFVLVPKVASNSRLPDRAKERGIGVFSHDADTVDLRGFAGKDLPRSYGSWLFNEWVWRADCLGIVPAS
jgi:hypothetical protein